GKKLAVSAEGFEKNMPTPTDIVIWDVATEKRWKVLSGHKSGVFSIAFSKDGKTLFSAGGQDQSLESWGRGDVKAWSIETDAPPEQLTTHGYNSVSIAIVPNKPWIAVGSSLKEDKQPSDSADLRILDVRSKKCLFSKR